MRDYIAARIARTPRGRILWRLYRVRSNGSAGPADAVGDYSGHPGRSGLAKIRSQLAFRGRVTIPRRVVRDQVVFRVGGKT